MSVSPLEETKEQESDGRGKGGEGKEGSDDDGGGGTSEEKAKVEQPTAVKPARPSSISMPSTGSLSDLTFHSPSAHIVGTPFAVTSLPFEYPFPENSSAEMSTLSTSPTLSGLVASSSSYSAITPNNTSIAGLSSMSQPHLPNASGLPRYSSSFNLPADLPSYSPTHPKLRSGSPPVPPNLARKRHRWSLSVAGRRRSGSVDSARSDSVNSNVSSTISETRVMSSIASTINSEPDKESAAPADADADARRSVVEMRRVMSTPDNLGGTPSEENLGDV